MNRYECFLWLFLSICIDLAIFLPYGCICQDGSTTENVLGLAVGLVAGLWLYKYE